MEQPEQQQTITINQIPRPSESELRWAREWAIQESLTQAVTAQLRDTIQERDGLAEIIGQRNKEIEALRAEAAESKQRLPIQAGDVIEGDGGRLLRALPYQVDASTDAQQDVSA